MPTYNYQCVSCGFQQEEFHAVSANPEILCSECNSKSEKTFSPTENFILKGSGWPSQEMKIKKSMKAKNTKMSNTMNDRYKAGEGVSSISDLKKV